MALSRAENAAEEGGAPERAATGPFACARFPIP